MTHLDREIAARQLAAQDGLVWASLGPDERIAYGKRVGATAPEATTIADTTEQESSNVLRNEDRIRGEQQDLVRVTYVTSSLRRRVRTVTRHDMEWMRDHGRSAGIRVTFHRAATPAEIERGAYRGSLNA